MRRGEGGQAVFTSSERLQGWRLRSSVGRALPAIHQDTHTRSHTHLFFLYNYSYYPRVCLSMSIQIQVYPCLSVYSWRHRDGLRSGCVCEHFWKTMWKHDFGHTTTYPTHIGWVVCVCAAGWVCVCAAGWVCVCVCACVCVWTRPSFCPNQIAS